MIVDDLFEDQNSFRIGDPVIITGNVQFRGKTGDVRDVGRDGAFVVVDLYNYGPHSFHATDVSYNDYADSDDEAEYQQGVAEAQSMGGALRNALSRAEPGSKLDKKIRHHNDMVRRFGPEAGTITSAPDGYHIDKKGLIRLGQGVAEGVEDTRRQVNLKKKIDKGNATPEQKKEYEALKAKNTGKKPGVAEASDISGLIAAASMVQDYIITAEVDGQTKQFRVRGMTGPRAARERFLKHASQARVIDVKPAAEKNVAEADAEKIGDRYDPEEFDQMMLRLKKLAGSGPLKTVWDPERRVYKNVPIKPQDQK